MIYVITNNHTKYLVDIREVLGVNLDDENKFQEKYEYCIERKMLKENTSLHQNMRDSVAVLETALDKFKHIFPTYTDHSIIHSENVLQLCNALLKERIHLLNVDECYILAMSCYLHDVGMCITEADYQEFLSQIETDNYLEEYPDATLADIVRTFHNEFSGCFIKKYSDFFEIPTKEHVWGIIQVSRGHRKTDLFDRSEYPDIILENGNVLHLQCLAAIIRLADELDVTVERNSPLLYEKLILIDSKDIGAFSLHEAIRGINIYDDRIVLRINAQGALLKSVENLCEKIRETMNYCSEASKYGDARLLPQMQLVLDNLNTF